MGLGEAEAGCGGAEFLDDLLVDVFVADDSAFADVFGAGFELGFDENDALGPRGEQFEEGWEDEFEGDEGAVGGEEFGGFGELAGGEVADVDAFEDGDAGVLAEFPRELAVADVDSVNPGGAVLQEAVGETAGGGADVDGDLAGDVERPGFEGGFEFGAAAADVALFIADVEGGGVVEAEARFVEAVAGGVVDVAGLDEALGLGAGDAGLALDEDV